MSRSGIDFTVEKASVGKLHHLADANGGQAATISRIPDFHLPGCPWPLVYKEYKASDKTPSVVGLSAMVMFRSGLAPDELKWFDQIAAWPARGGHRGRSATGVVMRLVPDDFYRRLRSPTSGASAF